MAVVVVEDYDTLRQQMVEHLRREGHDVHGVDCGAALDELLRHDFTPQLLVLDLNLPLEDGLSIAQRMRRAYPDIGIVMLSVRRTSPEREAGYVHGADIYLPKPLQPSELSAAITALRRRLDRVETQPPWRLEVQALRLHTPCGQVVALTHFEALSLQLLARAPGQRLHREMLAEMLAEHGLKRGKDSLEVGFSRLRSKLAAIGIAEPVVKAMRGWGYQCCVPLSMALQASHDRPATVLRTHVQDDLA